jgi:hypothetical protein
VKGPRVRGETQIVPTDTEFFRCRIDPANATEVGRLMRKELEITHTMICALDDTLDMPLDFHAKDTVTVERGNQGSTVFTPYATFEVTGVVQRPRNLKKELLQVVPLRMLEEF